MDYNPFQTERLNLEPLQERHLDEYHSLISDVRVIKWSMKGDSQFLDQSLVRLKGAMTSSENPGIVHFSVYVREVDNTSRSTHIGFVGCHIVDFTTKTAMLGYMFSPPHWGKGYATEAVRGFLPVFWKTRPMIDKMEAVVDVTNLDSAAVLIKCGFLEISHDLGEEESPLMGLRTET
ncbi:acyl-CoA N-acyltransferase [Flagelloscypha sp. PMI_526]|nr:acyl-CoA N-acyltransferase [Flagelloscypha sp. PMI_526]